MNLARLVTLGSLGLAALLIFLLAWKPAPATGKRHSSTPLPPLLVYCAAALKPAVEKAAHEFEAETGRRVQIQFGGSGTLLSNLRIAKQGDLFIAADDFYLQAARSNQLVAETIPLARMSPVLAVAKGNPKQIRNLEDLERGDVRLALPNPETAAIGRLARERLMAQGRWQSLSSRAVALKPTVNDLANDLKLGSADAAIVWDATVRQYPELEAVPGEFLGSVESEISASVLAFSLQPAEALQLARFLGSPQRGVPHFERFGFRGVEGDAWAVRPEIVVYSGGVNRLAIEETLRRFEQREGVSISRVYNGCGLLTAQIRAGQKPDAYVACDVSFLQPVAGQFHAGLELAETRMVIAVKPGNPMGLKTLSDLARPGLKLGLAHEEQSALGALSLRVLREQHLADAVASNVVVRTPTADLLINQLRAGALDAALVYEANAKPAAAHVDFFVVDWPSAFAIQPVAVGRHTAYPRLMARLVQALASPESQDRFVAQGFKWRRTPKP